MLMPKRVKRRKVQKGRMRGKATRGNFLAYGDFGIQATECGWLTSNQIESARIAINRYIRRGGKLWIKVFPDKPITQKPAEVRMGSGKGNVEYWVAVVKPGRVLAILIGSAAAGPLYGAFPVAAVFMKKGVKFSNILLFIGAWSTTKIPMFLFEMASMGKTFAVTRLLINLPVIFFIALVIEKTLRKEDIDALYKNAENL